MSSAKDMTSDEVSLSELFRAIVARWRLVTTLSLTLAACAAAASFLVKPIFSADVLLMPIQQSPGGASASGFGSQFAGLASLAGINLPGIGSDQQEAIATMQSRLLTDQFIKDHNLLPELFSSQWDQRNGRWESDNPDKVPTLWDGTRVFDRKIRAVTTDKKTGLVTLSIRWKDPAVAASWANELVSRTNKILRDKAIERATKNLRFLEQQLDKTAVLEVRQSIYRLMENEIKTLTLAEGADEYAFKVVDPAEQPHRRQAPDRVLYGLSGLSLGLLGGILTALFVAPIPVQRR